MDELGGYRELTPQARALGTAVYLAALVLTAFLERFQFRLRATEGQTWWASNGRDVINAIALGLMMFGLYTIGFNGPIALCIAATVVVLLTAAQMTFEKLHRGGSLTLALALVLGTPVALTPRRTNELFRSTLEFLFG